MPINAEYKLRIYDLSQRWLLDLLTSEEEQELETWFWSLEDTSLSVPQEMTVEKLEIRLHELFKNDFKPSADRESPPYPL